MLTLSEILRHFHILDGIIFLNSNITRKSNLKHIQHPKTWNLTYGIPTFIHTHSLSLSVNVIGVFTLLDMYE